MGNRKNIIDEQADMINPVEFKEIEKELNQYVVKYPDEHKIDVTIDTLRQYVPNKNKQPTKIVEQFWTLMKHTTTEMALISKFYWLVSVILFTLGYLVTVFSDYNPLFTLVILAPVPLILGLIEVFKGREQGLLEMEMACKFSAHQIILSRLLLIGVFNITLNILLTVGFAPLLDSLNILEMLLIWFTPFTIFSAFALWLSMKYRGTVFVTILAFLWVLFSILVSSNPTWRDFIVKMHIALHFLFMSIGIIMIVFQIKQLMKKYTAYEEVGIIEVSH